jgi:hypothetical protein
MSALFLLVFSTCTKFGKNVYVDGYVRNAITGEPVPNVSLTIYRGQIDWKDPLGIDSKTLKTTTTDANGYYKLEYLSTLFNQVHIRIGGGVEGGYIVVQGGDGIIKKGKKNHKDYGIVPYGQLHWHIKNTNCEGITDTMWYKIKYQYNSDYLNLWSFPYIGCTDISGNGTDKVEMGNHIIYMKISRPSGIIYKYDTVFVNESGITNFDLFY